MRRTRWLVLAALLSVVAAVGYLYFARIATMARSTAPSRPLPSGIETAAQEWHYSTKSGDCPVIEVRAKTFKQIKEPATFELEGVHLQFFKECGAKFNLVESARAQFDQATGVMFSEGETNIVMNVPSGEDVNDKLVRIVSSGVKYDTKTGNATTERETHFTFAGGEGKCVGAEYSSQDRQIRLRNAVSIDVRKQGAKPMHIETELLVYLENEDKVVMSPWSKFQRDKLALNAAMSVVYIEQEKLQHVEAVNPWGIDEAPGRKLEYQAEAANIFFDSDGLVTSLKAERKAHLVSTSDTAKTDVTSDNLDLDFAADGKESVLTKAVARGNTTVDSNPIVKQGSQPPDKRILKSDVVEMKMRSGGKEIETAETQGPGNIEFIPNRPDQPHRTLDGDKIWITYGAQNRIRDFRTVNARTRTDNPPKNKKPQPPVFTSSKQFLAQFDEKTGQMSKLDQTTDFRYREGDREAQADKATLDQATDLMTLAGAARIADPTGSAAADRIVMNQKSGDFKADGRVNSVRLPDKKGASSSMLNNEEPLQAKADHMTSAEDNQKIVYEGHVVAWQGANRINAERLDIDRDEKQIDATGQVVSQFVDKTNPPKDGKTTTPKTAPAFTVIRAPKMHYTEDDRMAHYTGGVLLTRPNMTVKSRELKAYLKPDEKDAKAAPAPGSVPPAKEPAKQSGPARNSDSSLDKAFADGEVVIVQTSPGRTRTGTSDHAEYYTADEKIILEKGQPKFVDTAQGTTEGEKLTYFLNDDRLLVNGVESRRSKTVLLKRKK